MFPFPSTFNRDYMIQRINYTYRCANCSRPTYTPYPMSSRIPLIMLSRRTVSLTHLLSKSCKFAFTWANNKTETKYVFTSSNTPTELVPSMDDCSVNGLQRAYTATRTSEVRIFSSRISKAQLPGSLSNPTHPQQERTKQSCSILWK